MKKPETTKKKEANRQIVGLSLPPAVAGAFKVEAAKRGMTIRELFLEIWAAHQQQKNSS